MTEVPEWKVELSSILFDFEAELIDQETYERCIGELIDKRIFEEFTKATHQWQWKDWADAPRLPDQVQERIANAQYVTDWLRARAESFRPTPQDAT